MGDQEEARSGCAKEENSCKESCENWKAQEVSQSNSIPVYQIKPISPSPSHSSLRSIPSLAIIILIIKMSSPSGEGILQHEEVPHGGPAVGAVPRRLQCRQVVQNLV